MFERSETQVTKKKRISLLRHVKVDAAASGLPAVVGAFIEKKRICLIYSSRGHGLRVAESINATDFALSDMASPVKSCRHIQMATLDVGQMALANIEGKGLTSIRSKSQKKWCRPAKIIKAKRGQEQTSGAVLSHYQKDGKYLMFLGGETISTATSPDAKAWSIEKGGSLPITAKKDETIEVDLCHKLQQGILLCYRIVSQRAKKPRHRVHIALLDKHDPTRVIWKSPSPIWEDSPEWGPTTFGGAVVFRSQIYSFWNTDRFGIVEVRYPVEGIPFELPRDHAVSLEKAEANPVIFPRGDYPWEAFATYNPAAFYADGKVHILYRAQGTDLISSIGYAASSDGIHIDERLPEPVYLPQEVFESYQRASPDQVEQKYVSGGGIAGCEDPRVTLIQDRVYMTYVAFDGASPPRVALTSIALSDFLAKRWLWERPVLISPPGIVDKSAVIFPEKINGRFVIMHRIFPDILIDYQDDLNFDGSRWLETKSRIRIRENMWDSRKIGAGAPPIKTPEGWLLIYYGVDDRNDKYYKIGAMLLDLEDPAKVLYRSSTPILEPEDWYENSGFKPGIVYPCGAVQIEQKLFVYYGGADCVVCVATADLREFIDALKSNHELKLEPQAKLKIGQHATHKVQIKSHPDARH